jgi:hypothetical protein
MSGYPEAPGWKGQATSRAAAEYVAPTAGRMMDRIAAYLAKHGPASPEEITARIARPDENLLLTSVRARVCQLRNLGRVGDYVRASFGDPEALARIEQAGPGSALSRLILAAFGSGLRA